MPNAPSVPTRNSAATTSIVTKTEPAVRIGPAALGPEFQPPPPGPNGPPAPGAPGAPPGSAELPLGPEAPAAPALDQPGRADGRSVIRPFRSPRVVAAKALSTRSFSSSRVSRPLA